MIGFEDEGFDFEDKPEKILREKKKTGRPKKTTPLRNEKVYTNLSKDELDKLEGIVDEMGIPRGIVLRNIILDFMKNR